MIEILDNNVMACYCVCLQWPSCCSLKLATLDYVLHGSIDYMSGHEVLFCFLDLRKLRQLLIEFNVVSCL